MEIVFGLLKAFGCSSGSFRRGFPVVRNSFRAVRGPSFIARGAFQAQIGFEPGEGARIHKVDPADLLQLGKVSMFEAVQVDFLGLVVIEIGMGPQGVEVRLVDFQRSWFLLPQIDGGEDALEQKGVDTPDLAQLVEPDETSQTFAVGHNPPGVGGPDTPQLLEIEGIGLVEFEFEFLFYHIRGWFVGGPVCRIGIGRVFWAGGTRGCPV